MRRYCSFTLSLNCAIIDETEDNYYNYNRVHLFKHRQAGDMTLTHHKLRKFVYFEEISFFLCYTCILRHIQTHIIKTYKHYAMVKKYVYF